MNAPYLSVNVEHDGPVCVLALRGELDMITAPTFTARMSRVGWERAERLVLDLSGLSFTDCAGARALAAAVRAVPADCPIIVRSLQPTVRRVFELTGLDLENLRSGPDPHPELRTPGLVQAMVSVRSWSQESVAGLRRSASIIASTEERVAITFGELAARRPRDAARLLSLSDTARRQAAHYRRLAGDRGRAGGNGGARTRNLA